MGLVLLLWDVCGRGRRFRTEDRCALRETSRYIRYSRSIRGYRRKRVPLHLRRGNRRHLRPNRLRRMRFRRKMRSLKWYHRRSLRDRSGNRERRGYNTYSRVLIQSLSLTETERVDAEVGGGGVLGVVQVGVMSWVLFVFCVFVFVVFFFAWDTCSGPGRTAIRE